MTSIDEGVLSSIELWLGNEHRAAVLDLIRQNVKYKIAQIAKDLKQSKNHV